MNPDWMEGLKAQCKAECVYHSTGKTWSIFLLPEEINDAAIHLYDHEFFLEDITAIDGKDGFVAVYHFDHFSRPGRVALYVVIPRDNPEMPSISNIFSGAEWHEREVSDFFGIRFIGHPNPAPLLLPEDMDFHPLVKTDETRRLIRELLEPGKIVEEDPGFALFREDGSVITDEDGG